MPNNSWLTRRRLLRVGEWVLLFFVILIAIWTVTQNAQAPQLILLALLFVITINFSLPPKQSSVGLVPLVAVSSLLTLGLNTAVSLAIASFILAELTAPLWNAFWEQAGGQRPSRRQRPGHCLYTYHSPVDSRHTLPNCWRTCSPYRRRNNTFK